ncbi:MAG: hypothetical protein ACK553_12260 [Planctomycetota bacterium]|jgi:hypothetical protein
MPSNDPVSSNAKMYVEFPLSIRIAQRSMLLAVLIPILLVRQLRFPWLRFAVLSASGACAAVGFIATYYAVVRYPYMGLVDAVDGDLFSKYIESQKKWVQVAAILICLVIAIAGVVVPMLDGRIVVLEWVVILYAAAVLVFVMFLLFYYDPTDHPTIATFLRCSMGLGIFLYPFFVPALVIGSMRVDRLLDEAVMKMEYDRRHSPSGR